ncbi:MAG: MurR/RpiR family transcriptional regulator [Spirochaetes bacterium]|nr:MurR/RpiR family transcriptional regulator [Spirochaetota bacterium]
MESKIFELIKEYKNFSKKQKAIYDYIIKNAYNISMMSAAQLAAAVNVGEATLFRFLKQIGYETYADLKADVHTYALNEMNSNYLQLITKLKSDKENGPGATIRRSIDLLEKTVSPGTLQLINQAVELMLNAPQTGVLGLRSSKAVALYFEYTLLPFFPKISQLSHDELYLYDRLQHFTKDSAVFLIAGWPGTKSALNAARYCAEAGIKIILLTNNPTNPIAPLADVAITVLNPRDYYSIVPFVAVLEAIAVEIAFRMSPVSDERLKNIGEVLARYGIVDGSK